MAGKTAVDIENMTDEELLQAAADGSLGEVDGSDPEQREEEDEEEGKEEGKGDDEEEPEEEQEEEEEDEEEEDDDEHIVVAGKKYTKDEYEALLEDLESNQRAIPVSALREEREKRQQAEERTRNLELQAARVEGANEAVARAAAAAERAAKEAQPKFDFKEKRREYLKLIEEAKYTEAAALDDEIETERERVAEAKITAARAEAEKTSREEINKIENKRAMDNVAASLYARYPFLDNRSKDADKTCIFATIALRNDLIAQGKSPVEALHAAMIEIGDAELKKRPALKKKDAKSSDPDKARRAAALRKAITTNGKQPPRPGGIGNRHKDGKLSERDIKKMSDEDFARLTDEQLAELDGRRSQQRERA